MPPPQQIADGTPRSSRSLFRAFGYIARRRLRRNYRAVLADGIDHLLQHTGGPIFLYLNHPSWWDPLVCVLLAQKLLPGLRHYAPMDELALRQYGFFVHLGVFPVAQNSLRGAAQFLRGAQGILRGGGALWITAQGRFQDVRVRPVQLRSGLGALMHRTPDIPILPIAIEYTFWDQRLPEVLVSIGPPVTPPVAVPPIAPPRGSAASDWTAHLEQSLQVQQDRLAELALRRDPDAFHLLLRGSSGTSGVYGLWQRLRAQVRGERYQPDHAPERPS